MSRFRLLRIITSSSIAKGMVVVVCLAAIGGTSSVEAQPSISSAFASSTVSQASPSENESLIEPGYGGSLTSRAFHALLGVDPIQIGASYLEAAKRPGFRYTTNRVMRQLPDIESLVFSDPESTCGADNRKQITNTTAVPWRWNCRLVITLADGRKAVATGWLAGPRMVVTAGHCLHSGGAKGTWVRSVEVIPGMNGGVRPYGTLVSTTFRVPGQWSNQKNASFDYGAIILDDAIGERIGFYGFAALTDGVLKNSSLNVAGYPSDKPLGTLWHASGKVSRLETRRVLHSADLSRGQNGSAIYRLQNAQRTAIAIQSRSGCPNIAIRITPDVLSNLRSWGRIVNHSPGLVAYFPFDSNAQDKSPNANHGEVKGAVLSNDRFGLSRAAYRFEGNGEHIEVKADDLPQGNGARTLIAWIRQDEAAGKNRSVPLAWGTPNDGRVFGLIIWDNTWGVQFFGGGQDRMSGRPVESGWHMLSVTLGDGAARLYHDGELILDTPRNADTGGQAFFIGAGLETTLGSNDLSFRGWIDDVRVFDRVLTTAEIKRLYENGKAP